MNELSLHNTPGLKARILPRVPALGLAGLPSFARALRQRGLMTTPCAGEPGADERYADEPEADEDESWIPVLSVFEAHLRRRAMEQAFASMRADGG